MQNNKFTEFLKKVAGAVYKPNPRLTDRIKPMWLRTALYIVGYITAIVYPFSLLVPVGNDRVPEQGKTVHADKGRAAQGNVCAHRNLSCFLYSLASSSAARGSRIP